jgi:biopolymer transport protein ExbB/biopolymer transport protein TolQ
VFITGLNMYSLLSPDPMRKWDPDGMVRSIRILAQGAFILLLIIGLWWRQGIYIDLGRYIQAVYALLFIMAGCLITVTIERSIRYGAARNQSRSFLREVAKPLHDRNLDQAFAIAGRYRRSPSAKVVASGLGSFQAAMPLLTDAEVIETTQRAMRRSAAAAYGELKRGLALLASVGSTAPLVGAFGTVLGIVNLFRGFDGAFWTIFAYLFEALADALLLTALSLVLGVLTMWCYKYLNSEVEAFDREMKNESVRLVNYLVIHLGRQK